jgi:hypothetical protein
MAPPRPAADSDRVDLEVHARERERLDVLVAQPDRRQRGAEALERALHLMLEGSGRVGHVAGLVGGVLAGDEDQLAARGVNDVAVAERLRIVECGGIHDERHRSLSGRSTSR